jgi:aspartate 1-decarboxylase
LDGGGEEIPLLLPLFLKKRSDDLASSLLLRNNILGGNIMIVYKNSFDDPSIGAYSFPTTNFALIDFLVASWSQVSAFDIWNTTGSHLVQTHSSANGYIVANTGDIDQRVKVDLVVGSATYISALALSTNATATIGVLLTITPTRISIVNAATGAGISTLVIADEMRSTTLSLVGYKHGSTVYFSVYDSVRMKTYVITTERARSPLTFSTYIALKGASGENTPDGVFDNLQVETLHSRVDVTEAMLTLTTLRSRVQEEVQDGGVTTASIDAYLNRAYTEIYMAEHWRERKFTADIILHEGVEEYGLPVAIGDIGSIRRYNGMLRYDGEKALEQIYSQGTESGTPENITFNGRTIKFSPIPSIDWEGSLLRCEYYAGLTRIATNGMIEPGGLSNATDYPNLHPALHECVAQLAAIKLMATLREDGIAPAAKRSDYARAYAFAKDQALGKDISPAQVRIYRR